MTNIRTPLISLIYAEAGEGKTTLACNAEKPFMIDFENKCYHLPPERIKSFLFLEYNKDTRASYEYLYTELFNIEKIPEDKGQWADVKTLIIDGLSGLSRDFGESWIVKKTNESRSAENKVYSINDCGAFGAGHFKVANMILLPLLRRILNFCAYLNLDLIILCHDKKQSETRKINNKVESFETGLMMPDCNKATMKWLAPKTTHIFYIKTFGQEKRVYFSPENEICSLAKCDPMLSTEKGRNYGNIAAGADSEKINKVSQLFWQRVYDSRTNYGVDSATNSKSM